MAAYLSHLWRSMMSLFFICFGHLMLSISYLLINNCLYYVKTLHSFQILHVDSVVYLLTIIFHEHLINVLRRLSVFERTTMDACVSLNAPRWTRSIDTRMRCSKVFIQQRTAELTTCIHQPISRGQINHLNIVTCMSDTWLQPVIFIFIFTFIFISLFCCLVYLRIKL